MEDSKPSSAGYFPIAEVKKDYNQNIPFTKNEFKMISMDNEKDEQNQNGDQLQSLVEHHIISKEKKERENMK